MSLITPLALAFSALAIPIVLLYMLRLRRTEMPISSTLLWRQLVRDREANAPWQRLRFSWLLLLQLLILAALVLALARPFTEVKTISTGRIVLLLDGSASMKATDVDPNRFEAARQIGLDLVDTLGSDDTMTVIQVSAVPEVLAAASRDKLVLRRAIESAQASDVGADWFAALTLAAAGAVGVDDLNIVIVTDGGLPSDLPPVPGNVRFVPVGKSGDNLAISALATSALPGRPPQLFARITNYGDTATDVILDIRLDGSDVIYTARRYTIPAQDHVDISDIDLPDTFNTLTARLTLPGSAAMPDYLDVDNVAYAVLDRSGAGRVLLITQDNLFLEQIFRSLRGVELYQITPADNVPTLPFDLYVFDGVLPARLPAGNLLLVNPPDSGPFFTIGDSLQPTGSIIANPDDPRTQNLTGYVNSINLQSFRALSGIDWGTVLLQVDGYPLVVAGEVDNRQVAILSFDARYPNTDMVLQPAWPILIAELTTWFSPPGIMNVTGSLSPGAPVTVRFIEGATGAVITLPNDRRVTLTADSSEAVFADTLKPGLYRVDLVKNGSVFKSEPFAVDLFDPGESRIAPRENVTIGTQTIARATREEIGRREFWPWVVGIGLALLMAEWWVYHRSVRRIPRVTLGGLRGDTRGSNTILSRLFRRDRSRRGVSRMR
jgi:Ca-activated chloride channel family protein